MNIKELLQKIGDTSYSHQHSSKPTLKQMRITEEKIKLYCPECGCEVEAVKGKLKSCCGTEIKGKDKCSCC